MGAYRELYFWKNFIECLFIHAVNISASVHSDHKVVVVGALRVAHYWELQVLPLIELSPVGFNMVNCLKHTYPWWIWLSDSHLIDVGVIVILGALSNVNTGFRLLLALAHCGNVQFYGRLCI